MCCCVVLQGEVKKKKLTEVVPLCGMGHCYSLVLFMVVFLFLLARLFVLAKYFTEYFTHAAVLSCQLVKQLHMTATQSVVG